ncbi:MAG: hypothetical protein ICV59_04390 [Thermoleophilia bacterium]|nr:hypothetical protein [Thermoleophilia bacterium]
MHRVFALAALALAAGCGGAEERAEPLRTAAPGIDLAAERWGGEFWELRARCAGGAVRLEFRPGAAIELKGGGGTLASASLKTIALRCGEARRHTVELDAPKRYDDARLRGPVTARASLVCSLPDEIEVAVHPIWYKTDYVSGSVLALATADLRLAAAASMKHDRHGGKTYSHLSYVPDLCRPAESK